MSWRIPSHMLAAAALTAGVATVGVRLPESAVVGVLEIPRFGCDTVKGAGVRALFANPGSGWIALKGRESLQRLVSREMSWTVAFDGRKLGAVRTVMPEQGVEDDWSVEHNVLPLAPDQTAPQRAATPGMRFEGFTYHGYNRDGYTMFANDFRTRADVRWTYH